MIMSYVYYYLIFISIFYHFIQHYAVISIISMYLLSFYYFLYLMDLNVQYDAYVI